MSASFPPPLFEGAAVRVVAPAGPVEGEALEAGLGRLLTRGLDARGAGELSARAGYLAGDDASRLRALQEAIDDPGARAIWAARGGYGTTRILDRLRLDRFARDPIWLVGSSDLTALLLELWVRHRVVSIHGPMVARFGGVEPRDVDAALALLGGGLPAPVGELVPVAPGAARGPFVGGNLVVIAHCLGALPPSFADGAILFLEEIGERPYRIDRCLVQLARAGILSRAAGVVLGEFTACDPNPDGVTAADVLRERFSGLGIPVAAGYPAAHGARNLPFLHGAEAELVVEGERAELRQRRDRYCS